MQRITWYALLAVVALVAPTAGQTKTSQTQAPQPKVREIATIPGITADEAVRMPNGRVVLYGDDGSIFAYDLASKRTTVVTAGFDGRLSISRGGDRLAYDHASEDGKTDTIWSIPINPATGAATGQAQRVTIGVDDVDTPSFSPDGKLIAFEANPAHGQGPETPYLAVVPTLGGPQRVLAKYDRGIGGILWSADGKWIFLRVGAITDPTWSIQRVPAAGGRSESVVSFSRPGGFSLTSNDGQTVFYVPDKNASAEGRMAYMTAAGAHAEFSIPAGAGRNSSNFVDVGSPQSILIKVTKPLSTHILSLVDGKAHDLLPGNPESSTPQWSPDGRRLALLGGAPAHHDIIIVNADGSSPRHYAIPMHADDTGFGAWRMPWSPDGRFLALRATEQQVGPGLGEHGGELVLLDLNSGQTRVLTASSATTRFFVWRPDGQAIRAIRTAGTFPNPRWTIVEIPLNGVERPLRDVAAEFPGATGVIFTSYGEAIVRVPSDQSFERFVLPLDGGPARRLSDPGINIVGSPMDGNRLLVSQTNAKGETDVMKILSTVGEPTRTLRLPAGFRYGGAHPDGKQLISVIREPDGSLALVLIPLDGSPTHRVGNLPSGADSFVPSPDGKTMTFTAPGSPSSTFYELDLSPILQSLVKK